MNLPKFRWRSSAFALPLAMSILSSFASVASAASSHDNLKVGIISVVYNATANQIIADAVQADCKRRHWTCELFDGKGDPVATSNAGVNFVNRKFDAIINVVSDNNQLTTVIKAAKAANIPYVSLFSGDAVGITADVGASGVVQGALVGGELRSAIGLKGKVAVVTWNVLPILRERTRGFKASIADDKNIQVVDIELKVPGYIEDAYNQVTTLLQSNKDIKAIMLGWNELAPSVIRAIEQAGMRDQIKVYSYDLLPAAVELMHKKDSPLVFTVGTGLVSAAKQAMNVTAEAVDGKSIPFRAVMVRDCVFTKENVPPIGSEPDYSTCTPFTGEIHNE